MKRIKFFNLASLAALSLTLSAFSYAEQCPSAPDNETNNDGTFTLVKTILFSKTLNQVTCVYNVKGMPERYSETSQNITYNGLVTPADPLSSWEDHKTNHQKKVTGRSCRSERRACNYNVVKQS